MFRELTRKKQSLPWEDCVELLTKERRGVLSVQGDDGYPYAMPMNHFYCEEDGCLYFHCGKTGHRTDALRRCDKVSFCVYDQGYRNDGEWALNVKSVIVFGKISFVEDLETVIDVTTRLCHKFTQDEAYIADEIAHHASHTVLLRLTPEHMTGKRVQES